MMNEWIISSSVLIAAVLLGRFLLRGKISLRLQYALWAIVLLRLLVPFQIFVSPFGTGAVSEQVDLAAPVRQVYHSANEDRYEEVYDTAYREVKHSIAIAHPDPIVIEQAARELAQSRMELDLARTMFRVWFVGMAAMAAVIVGCNVHLAGRLRRHRREMEVPGCLLPVYVTEVVPTPCVFGLFRPVIYLTPQTAEEGQVRDHVLEHELTHYRHLDHIWSGLRSLCLVLHWYNPLVWAAAKVSRADAELACDEGALARLGEEARGDYGRTLIGLTCDAPVREFLITATTMTGSPGSIRERIRLLMKRPRNTVLTVITVILMVTLIVGCTFAGAPETTQPGIDLDDFGEGEIVCTLPISPTHGVDNDMSYTDQDLPIPEVPGEMITTVPPFVAGYAPSMQEALVEYADKNPRLLTDAEVEQVHETFRATVYDEKRDMRVTNPITAFFTSYYAEVRELDLKEFLRYFPTSGSAKETEFQQLKDQYGSEFAFADCETLAQMPVPVHCYRISHIDEVLRKYANLPFQELTYKDAEYHLEATGCYYNFTSDFGPGSFDCTEGFVYDGGAILYTDTAALYLEEIAGSYIITAHLPSRNLDPRKAAIAETLEAFFLAYEENLNLNRDNGYDHLTVLAADPERTVEHQGKKVPLSNFYGNIEYLHGKEAYWKHVRRDSDIVASSFQVAFGIEKIRYDGDIATVQAHDHASFYYAGLGAPSGMGGEFEILMVQVDGEWLIADIFEQNDWFDAEYKNDPKFDPEELIASVID